ncbi:unnamed protein product [Mytilus coruscus]|uniref:Uncharacterized protein n=1 Tax=Mytilus coruscus TaxID=42192 RepID=A0A6J8AZ31_MYTCO|nr:unnamed protein product [Mytilus coruscus]
MDVVMRINGIPDGGNIETIPDGGNIETIPDGGNMETSEKTTELVTTLIKSIDRELQPGDIIRELQPGDIIRSHRIGPAPLTINSSENENNIHSTPPRQIIVRLKDPQVKKRILRCKKLLKNSRDMKYVKLNEDLTKTRNNIAYKIRQLKIEQIIKDTWTNDGKIMVKDNQEQIHVVNTQDSFDQFCTNFCMPGVFDFLHRLEMNSKERRHNKEVPKIPNTKLMPNQFFLQFLLINQPPQMIDMMDPRHDTSHMHKLYSKSKNHSEKIGVHEKWGRVIVYVKENIHSKRRDDLEVPGVESSSLIDLIITDNSNFVPYCGVGPPLLDQIRYHCPVIGFINAIKPACLSFKRKIWLYKQGDFDEYRRILTKTNWDSIFALNDVDEINSEISNRILDAAEISIPNRIVTIRKTDPTWLNNDLRKLIRKKNRIHSKQSGLIDPPIGTNLDKIEIN